MTPLSEGRILGPSPLRRAYRSLGILLTIAVLMAGVLSVSLTAPPGPLTGLSFLASTVVFIVAFTLAARVVVALERARRRVHPAPTWPGWRVALGRLRNEGPRQAGLCDEGSSPAGSPSPTLPPSVPPSPP